MTPQWNDIRRRMESLHPGHHGCYFFQTPEETVEVTAVFLQIGLERNEQCVYLAEDVYIIKVKDALVQAGIDVAREEQSGRLILTSSRDYLVNGRFDKDNMVRFLDKAYHDAMRANYTGLRATGDVFWELDGDVKNLQEYEKLLDVFLQFKKITGLCQYNQKAIKDENLRGALFCHNAVVHKAEVHLKNPFYNLTELLPIPFDKMWQLLK